MLRAVDIEWDVDLEGMEKPDLLSEVEIPEGMDDPDEISDYLSDLTGFCHFGFRLVGDDGEGCETEETNDAFDDYNYCYECSGYGDDYYIDDNGELQCSCDGCPFNYAATDFFDD